MYTYKYRKQGRLFWKKAKGLVGHQVHEGKMVFVFANGSQLVIAEWDKYDAFLGTDWVLHTKKEMEKQSGQSIVLDMESPE